MIGHSGIRVNGSATNNPPCISQGVVLSNELEAQRMNGTAGPRRQDDFGAGPLHRTAHFDRSPAPLFQVATQAMWWTLYDAYAWAAKGNQCEWLALKLPSLYGVHEVLGTVSRRPPYFLFKVVPEQDSICM
jgi:hypothetical protein